MDKAQLRGDPLSGSPELPEQAAGWQGEVEHIQSGRRWTFDGLDQLITSVPRQVEGSEEPE